MVISIIAIIAILAALFLIKPTRRQFRNKWPELSWILVVTFLGVFLAFFVNSLKQEYIERNIFKYKLVSLIGETCENLGKINRMKPKDTKSEAKFEQLNSQIARQIFSDPLIHEHGGMGLFIAISSMTDAIEIFNKKVDYIEIFDKDIREIQDCMDKAEYRIKKLQKLLLYYTAKYKVILSKEPGYRDILKSFSEKFDYKKELERMRAEEN